MITFLAIVILCSPLSALPTGREDIVYPSLVTLRSGEKRLSFRALDQDFYLKLQPAGDIIPEGFYVESTQDERRSDDNSKVDIHEIKRNLYKDKETGSSLYIDERDLLQIKGIINSNLRILPHGSERRRDGKVAHRIMEVEDDQSHLNDEINLPRPNNGINNTADEGRSGQIYYVEICVITDIKFSLSFPNEQELLIYVSVLFNGMKLRYDNLANITMKLLFSGIKIVTLEIDQPYIEKNKVEEICTEVSGCLTDFAQYAKKYISQTCDIVVLITKRPICDVEEDGKVELNVLGIAYVGGVCDTTYRVGIGEDNAICWDGARTMAHEIAHLLGCPHDGDPPSKYLPGHPGSAECPWSYGYLMSYEQKDVKQYYLSPCCERCIAYMCRVGICLTQNNTRKSLKYSDDNPGDAVAKKLNVNVLHYKRDRSKYYEYRCSHVLDTQVYPYKFPDGSCNFACRSAYNNDGYFRYWTFPCMDGDMCSPGKKCLNGICQ